MIRLFETRNFKGFKDKLSFDFTAHDYSYNSSLVRNGIVNKALVYGKNGTGKTNLTIALFDIILHLTDKQRMPSPLLQNYRNLDSGDEGVWFHYVFQFDTDTVDYQYYKSGPDDLLREKLAVNGKQVIFFDYFDKRDNYVDSHFMGDLNTDLLTDNKLSIIKFIYKNTPTNSVPAITRLVTFCEHMLWFRSLSDGNTYAGFTNGGNLLSEILYQSGKLKEFEKFLQENGLYYHLAFKTIDGAHKLFVEFENGEASYESVFSAGTRALFLFFDWELSFHGISFLAIDEFDAYYHYESAEYIVKLLNRNTSFQSVLTSHNTYLMQNRLTRPDCCYILSDGRLSCLSNCTDKEIREAHNLEKMYINGVFTDGN